MGRAVANNLRIRLLTWACHPQLPRQAGRQPERDEGGKSNERRRLTRSVRGATLVASAMVVLIILGFLFLLAGIAGCVLPVIPGPPLAFVSLILLSFARNWEAFSPVFLIVLGVVSVAVTLLDNLLPIITSKTKGASKAGVWGALVGMVAGMVFFPPFGVIIGTFLGAVAGELLFSKRRDSALKAGWGVFIGVMLGIGLKLAVSGVIAVYFLRALLRG